jgi:hypothetical protein
MKRFHGEILCGSLANQMATLWKRSFCLFLGSAHLRGNLIDTLVMMTMKIGKGRGLRPEGSWEKFPVGWIITIKERVDRVMLDEVEAGTEENPRGAETGHRLKIGPLHHPDVAALQMKEGPSGACGSPEELKHKELPMSLVQHQEGRFLPKR